jgi:hypothetical protein
MLLNNLNKKYPYVFSIYFKIGQLKLAAYDMLLMSYAYYYLYYEKAQMTSRKGPNTPLEGVWWGL